MAVAAAAPARIPWHRRLEARVAAGVSLLIAAALGASAFVATSVVQTRSIERATVDLEAARSAFDSLVKSRAEFAASSARVFVSAQPYFRAFLYNATNDVERQTLAGMAEDYGRDMRAAFTVLSDQNGKWVGSPGWPAGEPPSAEIQAGIRAALGGASKSDIVVVGKRLFLAVTEPARFAQESLGTITVAYPLDDGVAEELARVTHSEVNLVAGTHLSGSSLDAAAREAMAARIRSGVPAEWSGESLPRETFGGARYLTRSFPLSSDRSANAAARLVLLRDWQPTQQFIDTLQSRLIWAGLAIFIIALGAGLAFARRTSRPLTDIAEAAGDIASGNWTRRIPERGSGEAMATARAFNEMTASLQHWYDDAKDKAVKLQQAQKMEAIGRLAGGVAHDFNNLLTAIRGYGDEVYEKLEPGDPRRADMKEVLDAADRATALTRQLLAFSRQQILRPQVLALDEIVARTQKLLQRLIGEDIELSLASDPFLGMVRADPGQIEQILVNLAVNARDAMPTGGRLTIGLTNVQVGDTRRAGLAPGRYIELSVSDSGQGMHEDIVAHIFEPFFTTKAEGKGTGLGLATVYGIVQQSDGAIEVESVPNAGTTFRILLPQVDDAPAAAAPQPQEVTLGGTETVLLVEDDDHVRAIISKSLIGHGYTVLEACSGDQALDLVELRAGAIDLLLTDVVMPGISGSVLAQRIKERVPNVQVMFMSGYSDEAVLRHGVRASESHFLQKPFPMDVLLKAVRRALQDQRL
jgi:signal transduction histidine kinase/ActR/RegA family two-component response regulator